jgi:predicted RNA-binding Zn ribbon-like protein
MTPRELPVIGGHIALDFANTVDNPLGPTRHDHIADYDALLNWSLRMDTITEDQAAGLRRRRGHPAVRRAHELRDVLNDVFGAAADGVDDLEPYWLRLRPFAAAAQAAATLDTGAEPHRLSWARSDDLTAPLHPVAHAAAGLLVSEDLRRIKRCSGCPWLFLDRSRNHSRRWCDMGDCGTVEKMQRYVDRRAARRRVGTDQH